MGWNVACLALALAGCVIETDYTGTHFRCEDGKTCPDGFQCVDRICVSNPDLSVSFDASADLAPLPPACGKTADFRDDFDNGQVASFWTTDTSNAAATQGGQLTITLANQPSSTAQGVYRSIQRTDLTGSRLFIDVIQATNTSSHAEAFLRLRFDANDWIAIAQSNDALNLQLGGSSNPAVTVMPYDNVTHRWWQLRESAGTVYFETSVDGVNWTTRGSVATPWFAASVSIEIGAEAAAFESSPGTAQFDNLNGGGSPMAPACDR
jgi:hypothetical protein